MFRSKFPYNPQCWLAPVQPSTIMLFTSIPFYTELICILEWMEDWYDFTLWMNNNWWTVQYKDKITTITNEQKCVSCSKSHQQAEA